MACLEIIVERFSEAGVGSGENCAEHKDDNVAEDEFRYVGAIAVIEPILGGERCVKQKPDDCSGTSATVNTPIMENLGQTTPNEKWERVWC